MSAVVGEAAVYLMVAGWVLALAVTFYRFSRPDPDDCLCDWCKLKPPAALLEQQKEQG